MGKITVEMFCKEYKKLSKGNDRPFQEWLKKHVVTDYIPYLEKDVLCTNIVNVTTKVKDNDREFIKINSTNRHMIFVMRLISLYTDIDIVFEDGSFIKQYDELNKIGAIYMLLNGNPDKGVEYIPLQEYAEFSALLNMKLDDFYNNEYSITALLYNLKQTFSLSEEVISDVVKALKKQSEET